MKQFYMAKLIFGFYRFPDQFFLSEFSLLLSLLSEIWSKDYNIHNLQKFLEKDKPEDDYHATGFNDVFVEDRGDGFIRITFEWAEGDEYLFPKEKFKELIDKVREITKQVYSVSIFEGPDLIRFTIDDDWNSAIEPVYLNTDESFFEKDDSGRPQFRLKRIMGHQYKLVENDCIGAPISKTLGMFVEDVWEQPKNLNESVDFRNSQEDGTMFYSRTFLKKEGSQFTIGIQNGSDFKSNISLSKEELRKLLVNTRSFINSIHDTSLDRLPGMFFFTVDKDWYVIAIALFRPADKNFVNRE